VIASISEGETVGRALERLVVTPTVDLAGVAEGARVLVSSRLEPSIDKRRRVRFAGRSSDGFVTSAAPQQYRRVVARSR
jgi:hypothetical protein